MWKGNQYYYSKRVLRAIAENYTQIYDGLEFRTGSLITNPWSLAEYKADFDRSLDAIGKGHWTGNMNGYEFKHYINYGYLQRLIIAEIIGVDNNELIRLRFHDIAWGKRRAYFLMKEFLNRGLIQEIKDIVPP